MINEQLYELLFLANHRLDASSWSRMQTNFRLDPKL